MSAVSGFSEKSGSWFKIDGNPYSTQNGNESYSVSFSNDTFRFEVQPGDHWEGGTWTSERSEIRSETVYDSGEVINVSYSFMIEPGAANTASGRGGDGSWLVVGQFHADDWVSQPPFAIEMLGEKMAIVIRYGDPEDHTYKELYVDNTNIERGKYYDIDIEVRFQNNGNGFLNVWRDGEKIVTYSGPIGYDNGVYWKYGIYRSATDTKVAVNYKDMSVGNGGDGVLIVGTPSGDKITESNAPKGQPTVTDKGDTIKGGGGADVAVAGSGNDKIIGSKGKDVLSGGAGDDIIKGGKGKDKLYGVSGDNKIAGGQGKDTLVSGDGDDVLKGGKGKDKFIFTNDFGDNVIKGFQQNKDVIQFDKDLFADYAALHSAMSAFKNGTLIDTGDHSVFIDVKMAKLDSGDFLFS